MMGQLLHAIVAMLHNLAGSDLYLFASYSK